MAGCSQTICGVIAAVVLVACQPVADGDSGVMAQDASAGDGSVADHSAVDSCAMERAVIGTMVALGSSSVAGSGASDEAHRFVNLVATSVRADALLNLGRGGQRGADVVGALAEEALAAQPDLVVVLPFTDYASSDGETMAEAWRQVLDPLASGGARIYFGDVRISPLWVCGGLPTTTGRCYPRELYEEMRARNRAAAAALEPIAGLTLVPIYDDNAAHPEWVAPDGHPNDLGHANLAAAFLAYIEPELERRICEGEG